MTIDVSEVKRRLLVLLNDKNLVNDYVRQFGPSIDIGNIKTIRENRAQRMKLREQGLDGEDPVYELKVRCPVCNQKDITSYELKSKSQQISFNKFLVPVYSSVAGFRVTDYTLLASTVCHRCLFASPDKKDFIRTDPGKTEVKSQISSNILMALQETIGKRKSLLRSITDYEEYFKCPRTDESAIDSYQLALARVEVEASFNQPYSHYKMGSYSLRIAKILKDGYADNSGYIARALSCYEDAFKSSNCPSEEIEMQVLYLLIALNLKTGDLKTAGSYINTFQILYNTRLTEAKADPSLNVVTISKWRDKAKYLWEDRKDPELFKDE